MDLLPLAAAVGAALLALLPLALAAAHVAGRRRALAARRARMARRRPQLAHAAVVSLSPASHSPRAVNHVRALARSGKFSAALHAYAPCPELGLGEAVSFRPIRESADVGASASLLRKVYLQAADLYRSLVLDHGLARYDVIVVNTPPCIPVFAVVFFAARLVHACPVVVDWHNFAFSIMRVGGSSRRVVAVARFVEWFFGRQMDGHFCVSNAMSCFLEEEWAIDARVLYDRPPDEMRRISDVREQHELFCVLHDCAGVPMTCVGGEVTTIATTKSASGAVTLRSERPAVLVSSTSWTPDEDFNVLLDALTALDVLLATLEQHGRGTDISSKVYKRRVVCVITGRGPLRSAFEQKYKRSSLSFVEIWFAWLPREYYPQLLGCADLGISMHTSSSSLDLPMKVVDMLGCGLPVLAYEYLCIDELVRVGDTGLLFGKSSELAARIFFLLCTPDGQHQHDKMIAHILNQFSSPGMRWQATWESDALPLLTQLCSKN